MVIILICAFARPTDLSLSLGFAISLVGVLLKIWVAGYGFNVMSLEPHGPYRFVRHPAMLGTFLALFGGVLASRSAELTCMLVLATVALFAWNTADESQTEALQIGSRGREYRLLVPAFLPSILPYGRGLIAAPPFSFPHALLRSKQRQISSVIALVLGYGLLYSMKDFAYAPLLQTTLAIVLSLLLLVRILLFA